MDNRIEIEMYLEKNGLEISDDSIWSFDESIEEELLDLILRGIKTATSSLYKLYELEKEDLPRVGDLSIITSCNGEYVVLIETISVKIVPFNEVLEEHAFMEGEGDRSLSYWRKVHRDFFNEELKELNEVLKEDDLVVLEEFRVLSGLQK